MSQADGTPVTGHDLEVDETLDVRPGRVRGVALALGEVVNGAVVLAAIDNGEKMRGLREERATS
jgi:hypothetical protein